VGGTATSPGPSSGVRSRGARRGASSCCTERLFGSGAEELDPSGAFPATEGLGRDGPGSGLVCPVPQRRGARRRGGCRRRAGRGSWTSFSFTGFIRDCGMPGRVVV
jgi:hypothetical protein